MNEPIWETHPETTQEIRDALTKIESEHRSAIVHVSLPSRWWGYCRGEFVDSWDDKWPALQAIRDMLNAADQP